MTAVVAVVVVVSVCARVPVGQAGSMNLWQYNTFILIFDRPPPPPPPPPLPPPTPPPPPPPPPTTTTSPPPTPFRRVWHAWTCSSVQLGWWSIIIIGHYQERRRGGSCCCRASSKQWYTTIDQNPAAAPCLLQNNATFRKQQRAKRTSAMAWKISCEHTRSSSSLERAFFCSVSAYLSSKYNRKQTTLVPLRTTFQYVPWYCTMRVYERKCIRYE